MHTHIYAYVSLCVCIYIYIYTHVHIYRYIHIYTYIHMYTHALSLSHTSIDVLRLLQEARLQLVALEAVKADLLSVHSYRIRLLIVYDACILSLS